MATPFDMSFILLLILAAICYFSGNTTVTIAVLILLIFKLTPLSDYLPWLHQRGVTIGIVILTAAVMVPLANGTIGLKEFAAVAKSWQGWAAVLMGIFVAWLGYRGLSLMSGEPVLITGLILGTLIGVAFFKGIPVGPLIAAGLLSLVVGWR